MPVPAHWLRWSSLFLPRRNWRNASALGGHRLRLQGLDVSREVHDLLLGHQALESGHDGLIPSNNFCFGFEDRFTNVSVIGNYGRSIGKQNFGAVDTVERRAAASAVGEMAGDAGQLSKQPFASGRRVDLTDFAGKPSSIVRGIHDRDPPGHNSVIGPAVLGAEQTILADLGGAEPQGVVTARHDVHLDAEGGDVEIVDHVFAAHDELDVAIQGNVELVDFAAAIRLLQPPHPLLADHIDVQRVLGSSSKVDVQHGAPGEHAEGDDQRNYRPTDFQSRIALDRSAYFVRVSPAVFEGRKNSQTRDEHAEEQASKQNKREEGIHISREIGGALWNNWKR